MTRERPILFSGPLVRTILDGTKTQTRRPVKPQPPRTMRGPAIAWDTWSVAGHDYHCPCGVLGDRLWVRETCHQARNLGSLNDAGAYDPGPWRPMFRYAGDDLPEMVHASWIKRPSIHMPKIGARIWLEITDVRVERVRAITPKDAHAEGFCWHHQTRPPTSPRERFATAWRSMYDKRHPEFGWDANPWAWVVEFRVLSTTGRPT